MTSSTKEKSIIQGRVEKNYKENVSSNIPSNFFKYCRLLKYALKKKFYNFSSKDAKQVQYS
jgi:hypothetical protein